MKKIELYACEVCGTQYREKLKCQQCEKSHKKPVEVTQARYISVAQNRSGYPHVLHVKMSDGKIVEYRREGEIYDP